VHQARHDHLLAEPVLACQPCALQQVRARDLAEAQQEEVLQGRALGHLGQLRVVSHHHDRVGAPRLREEGALVGAERRAHGRRGRGNDDAAPAVNGIIQGLTDPVGQRCLAQGTGQLVREHLAGRARVGGLGHVTEVLPLPGRPAMTHAGGGPCFAFDSTGSGGDPHRIVALACRPRGGVASAESTEEAAMALKIMPHGRLQEWVAEEKGYFTAEGLEYSFVSAGDYGIHAAGRDGAGEIKTGAFETFGAGRDGADVSCACHWATSAAASERAGQLVTTAYSVAPCAVLVPPESPVHRPEDLAGVAVGVGYHSGSHFATLQALEAVLAPDQISLTFQGPPNERLDALLERQVPAGTMWGVPLYVAEAFGFRKVLDATFMIGFLVTGGNAGKADVDMYLTALRRAQMDIDLHPEAHKHYHVHAVPEKYRDRVDVRAFGTGERIVFLHYTGDAFAATRRWAETRSLFTGSPAASADYDEIILA